MRKLSLLGWVVLLVAGGVLAQGYQAGVSTSGLARTSDLMVLAPLNLYVAKDGGADTNPCTQALPCATIQHAFDSFPHRQICDAVTLTAAADYVGTGARGEIGWCDHPAGDGGVVNGSLLITGTLAAYAPADGGTGGGTFSSVSAGSNCTLDTWTLSGGGFNTNDLQNKLIGVTTGTGSGKDRLWPVFANDAGNIQPLSYGDATQPGNGSTFQVYDSVGSTTLNANLGQVVVKGGPGATQGSNAAAFEFTVLGNGLSNGAGDDRRLTIQHFVSTGSTTLAITNGGVNIRENFCQGSTCWRAAAGVGTVALERNVATAGIFALAANSSVGAELPLVQMYNNLGASTVTTALRVESAATVYSRGNYMPNGLLRLSALRNSWSTCDVNDAIRGGAAGLADANRAGQVGGWPMDGSQFLNNTGQTYTVNLANGFGVTVDQNGGPASTITSASHAVAVAGGSQILWSPTTTFNGGGFIDVVPTSTAGSVTIAQIHARPQKSMVVDFDGSRAMESGGTPGLWEPLSVLGTGRDLQCGTDTFSGTTKTVTLPTSFAVAPNVCWCNDTAGAATACSWTGTSLVGSANFIGGSGHTFVWCCTATKQ